jgi:hypothetical protein
MLRLVFILTLWLAAYPSTVMAQPQACPRADSCHGAGDMAMSPDGAFVAFTLMGTPATQFVLFEVETRRTRIVRAPGDHTDLRDLAWSPDGDELTFVTGAGGVFSGYGSSVWRLRPADSTPLVLLAAIPHVRHPVLSADGSTLATFEGVVLGDPPYNTSRRMAYALFERSISHGRATRRSEGQVNFPPKVFYDRTGALFLGGTLEPVFIRSLRRLDGRVSYYWGDGDENNRRSWQWGREIHGVASFRIAPGEMLAVWPTPFPANGAIDGASGMRPMDDGRVIAFVSLNGANAADWYDENGMPRTPTRELPYGYVAYDAQGVSERLVAPGLPEGVGRTGGSDISADGLSFAQVVSRNLRRGVHPANEVWDSQDTLEVYQRGELVLQTLVSEMTANAVSIQPTAPYVALMPSISGEPHRVALQER